MPNAMVFSHLWRDRTTLVGMGRGDRVVVGNPDGTMQKRKTATPPTLTPRDTSGEQGLDGQPSWECREPVTPRPRKHGAGAVSFQGTIGGRSRRTGARS